MPLTKALKIFFGGFVLLCYTLSAQSTAYWLPTENMNDANFWIEKTNNVDSVLLALDDITALYRAPTIDTFTKQNELKKAELIAQIDSLQSYAKKYPIYDSTRQVIKQKEIRTWQDALNKEKIPETITPQYGLITERTLARNFPFHKIILKKDFNPELDRSIESALYLGETIKIWHQSEDEKWFFVQNAQFFGWVEKEEVAILPYEDWIG